MPQPKIWEFRQLGGDQKLMYLGGWSAPFGRPRQGKIVNAGLSIRHKVTYYPGTVPPTVHSFGTEPKPWELRGRFMDQAIGTKNATKDLRRDWYDFVADQQVVRAKWGDILSYQIKIVDIDLDFESEAEIAWMLKAIVLVDEAALAGDLITPTQTPLQMAKLLKDLYGQASDWKAPALGNILDLLPQIADNLDTIISTLNAPFALVYNVCTALSDFETAATSDLAKIGSGLQTMQTGLINLRGATDSLVVTAANLNIPTGVSPYGMFSAQDTIALSTIKANADANNANLLALIASMFDQVDAAARGTSASAVQAQNGDSFESIAARSLGGSDAGQAIRDLNNVRHGAKPVPGKRYQIPKY